jgi:SAM-dependent methyltransferase
VSHLTRDLVAFIDRWLPAAPARVLEVGCGEGELTRRLVDDGYDALGLDPEAPAEPGYERDELIPLAELRAKLGRRLRLLAAVAHPLPWPLRPAARTSPAGRKPPSRPGSCGRRGCGWRRSARLEDSPG